MPDSKAKTAIKKDRQQTHDKYRDSLTRMKCVKTSLSSIVRDKSILKTLDDVAFRANKIVIHTYAFLKGLLCLKMSKNEEFPKIDRSFIEQIMFKIAKSGKKGGGRYFDPEISDFYDDHYHKLIDKNDELSYANMIQVVQYEAKVIMTVIDTHIQERFEQMLNTYINIYVDKKKKTNDGQNKDVNRELRRLKLDIFHQADKADSKYEYVKDHFNKVILGDYTIPEGSSLCRISQSSNKLSLLPILFRMSIDGEKITRSRLPPEEAKTNNIKIINPIPLRTSVKPKYIKIDTALAVQYTMSGNKKEMSNAITANKDKIWSYGFKTRDKIFKKNGYRFDNMIMTDGVGCSILFIREDLYGQKLGTVHKPYDFKEIPYVDDLSEDKRKELLKLNDTDFISSDPGCENIAFMTNGVTVNVQKENGKVHRKTTTFAYTAAQRKHERLTKRYKERIDHFRENDKIGRKTVTEIESELSNYNSSTCNWIKFRQYVRVKNRVNSRLYDFYRKDIHRRLRWYAYINTQRSDENMISRLKATFGDPEESPKILLAGDWSRTATPKFQAPTKGRSYLRLVERAGYEVFMVNEFRTSCREYLTGKELVNFRPDKESGRYVHRLLGSKILIEERAMNPADLQKSRQNEDGRPTIINRDLNAALNIRLKGMKIIKGEKLPSYFDRPKKADVVTEKVDTVKESDNSSSPIEEADEKSDDIPVDNSKYEIRLPGGGSIMPKHIKDKEKWYREQKEKMSLIEAKKAAEPKIPTKKGVVKRARAAPRGQVNAKRLSRPQNRVR